MFTFRFSAVNSKGTSALLTFESRWTKSLSLRAAEDLWMLRTCIPCLVQQINKISCKLNLQVSALNICM